jgi:t-SNARE complex subunit (syntaxin)
MNAQQPEKTMQQFIMMITDKSSKARGKPVVSTYAVAANTREEAIAAFDEEVGAHHRELAQNWSCAETQSRVVAAR